MEEKHGPMGKHSKTQGEQLHYKAINKKIQEDKGGVNLQDVDINKQNSTSRFFMHSNNAHLKHYLLKKICSQGGGGVLRLLICSSATKDTMFSFSSATKDAFQKFTLLSCDAEGGFSIPICYVAKLSSGRCCSFSSELVQPPIFLKKTIEAIIFPSCFLSHNLNNHATYLLNRNKKFFSSGIFGQITPLKKIHLIQFLIINKH